MHGYYQEDFVRSQGFREVSEGKLVTLEELVHMRKVLTDASLENLPLASSIKDDVKNGKVYPIRLTHVALRDDVKLQQQPF